jgi:diguanylate cyclase (GGDEF)-like protein/PAS domain S-box-containing protein
MTFRVLVVEDQAVVARHVQQTLLRLGYEVARIASSHEQALAAVAETAPDLVLMDVHLSGPEDGIEVAAKIDVPVIFITACAAESTLERARAIAPYGYLVKPFSERELHATILMAMERRRIETQLAESERSLALSYAELARAKQALEIQASEVYQHRENLLVTLKAIGDGVVTTDHRGVINFLNPAAQQLTGWTEEAACGQLSSAVLVLRHATSDQTLPCPIQNALCKGCAGGVPDECALIARDGTRYMIEDSIALIHNAAGARIGAVMVFRDVSAARRLAAEMTYQATHDGLTGLFNRMEFERRVKNAIESARNLAQSHALAYLDLDQFKIVNDTCGHAAGDELLRQVTRLLREPLRASDTVARLGGDEFGVLLEACPPEVAATIAKSLHGLVKGFRFVWKDRVFPIGISIGVVNFGGQHSPIELELNEILRAADAACYAAKEAGRDTIYTFGANDNEVRRRQVEMDWYSRIHRAMAENQFRLYAQDIAPLGGETGRFRHAEILLRLQDDGGRIVLPSAFLPAAERYGLVKDIDRWVILNAFEFIAAGLPQSGPQYAINLSGSTMNDETTLHFIIEQIEHWRIAPECLCFEITETLAIANMLTARSFISQLRAKGCKFALDDFGCGMASFAYLKHLPVDYIKIDGSFVKDMANSKIDAAMVTAINQIGHIMNMRTIAECVENDATLDLLAASGIDFAQGYGVGLPAPIAEWSRSFLAA